MDRCKEHAQSIAALGVFLLYPAVLLVSVFRHEMWRDELQAWMVASTASTFGDLLAAVEYEPDPNLWFAVLFLLGRITTSPLIMQLAHVFLATGTAALILWKAPFRPLQRVLLCCGYYFIFEYAVISRCYALAVLLLLGSCALARGTRGRLVGPLLLLALSMQVSVYAIILAMPLAMFHLWRKRNAGGRSRATALLVVFVALAVLWPQLAVPKDFAFGAPPPGSLLSWRRCEASLATISYGFLPFPRPGLHFWNTSVFSPRYASAIGVALLVVTALCFRRKKPLLLLYLAGALGLLTFVHLVSHGASHGGMRHYGFYFVNFVCCLWLGGAEDVSQSRWRRLLLYAMLACHVAAAGYAVAMDWVLPFSGSRAAAGYLDRRCREGDLIVGDPDLVTAPVAARLRQDFLFPQGGRFGTYVLWNKARSRLDMEKVRSEITGALQDKRRVFLLVRGGPPVVDGVAFRRVATFPISIVKDETYAIYEDRNGRHRSP